MVKENQLLVFNDLVRHVLLNQTNNTLTRALPNAPPQYTKTLILNKKIKYLKKKKETRHLCLIQKMKTTLYVAWLRNNYTTCF